MSVASRGEPESVQVTEVTACCTKAAFTPRIIPLVGALAVQAAAIMRHISRGGSSGTKRSPQQWPGTG